MAVTLSLILDKRRIKAKTGKYPVKLQVIHERVTMHYQTIFDLSENDYEKLTASRITAELQTARDKLKQIQRLAETFIGDMASFTFYEFEQDFVATNEFFKRRKKQMAPIKHSTPEVFDFSPYYRRFPIFNEDHSRQGCISYVYLAVIKTLLQEERIGTALSYKDSYNSIKTFRGNVLFTDINISFLHQYEQWMLKKGRSRTTVGIKLRPLRTMFNEAHEMGIIKKDNCYPFGRRKYVIPTGRNVKKALQQDQVSAVYYYQPESVYESKARDFWLFCYFGNGMNPKDVIYLKYKNIQGEYLVFVRHKTERTTRHDPKPITVYINEDMQRIMNVWGNKSKSPDDYIFPIMDKTLDPLKQYEVVQFFIKEINDRMAVIGQKLGIDKKITTIVSRHSFSTQMKRSGVSTEFIQEALGHTDKKTTENYLDSFENSVKKDFAGILTAFKKEKKTKSATLIKSVI